MNRLICLYSIFLCFQVHSQEQLHGIVLDSKHEAIPGALVGTSGNKMLRTKTNQEGRFTIEALAGDTLFFNFIGTDQSIHIVSAKDFLNEIEVTLLDSFLEQNEVLVQKSRMAEFDVGYLPPIKGVQITTGTNSVIELAKLNGAKSLANPREIFAKVAGLNIWESDGAGIQMGIGGRGLSPNRTANFNTRQNGYDISADALGYPESYYTPPIEALSSIEIIRGSASLQFGTQFGGMMNFIIKDPPANSPFMWNSRVTGGAYSYLSTFNRISGSHKRIAYQAYHQWKMGDGYRDNSAFEQHQAFIQGSYFLNEKIQLKLEYTHMNYLARQAGGLTDLQFELDARQSLRDRNWFAVNWNLLAAHLDIELSRKAHFNFRTFGMHSRRETLGFLGKVTQSDPGGAREMLQGLFQNAGAEARFLRKYSLFDEKISGAFLLGGRYYIGNSVANQGLATDGDGPDFQYANIDNLEGASFTYPSQNIAGFAENILFIGKKWTINSGFRIDNISSGAQGYYKRYVIHPVNFDTLAIYTINDTTLSQRTVPLFGMGSSFKLNPNAKIYTNFTQNYRAINFTDIRVNNPNITIDSLMRDEYGFTSELGFRGLKDDYFIYDLAAFYIFYGDKIGLAPKPGTILKERTNIGDAQNYGVELFAELDFFKAFTDSSAHSLSLFVNGAFIEANYIRSKEANYVGNKVEYVSSVIFRTGLKYRHKNLSLQVQFNYNSAQFSDASNSVEPSGDAVIGLVPDYYVMDFSCRYTFKRNFQLELGANNFTNQKYFTRRATGYPGPGILPSQGVNGYITLQYEFSTNRK